MFSVSLKLALAPSKVCCPLFWKTTCISTTSHLFPAVAFSWMSCSSQRFTPPTVSSGVGRSLTVLAASPDAKFLLMGWSPSIVGSPMVYVVFL